MADTWHEEVDEWLPPTPECFPTNDKSVAKPRKTALDTLDALHAELFNILRYGGGELTPIARCAMLSYRNSFCAINRLPTEILHIIFSLASREAFPTPALSHPTNLAISWVCSRWQAVSLSCGEMWSYIDARSPELASLLSKRSKSYPLYVSVPQGRSSYAEYTEQEQRKRNTIFAEILARARYMRYNVYKADVPTWVQLSPAPLLEELVLLRRDDRGDTDRIGLRNLFGRQMPQLRRVELQQCSLPWKVDLLRGLTHLTVDASWPSSRVGRDLLIVLQASPQLEELRLTSEKTIIIDRLRTTPPPVYQRVALRHLRRLVLILPLSLLVTLFNSIVSFTDPPLAYMQLECSNTPSSTRLLNCESIHYYLTKVIFSVAIRIEFLYPALDAGYGFVASGRDRRGQDFCFTITSSLHSVENDSVVLGALILTKRLEFEMLFTTVAEISSPSLEDVVVQGESCLPATRVMLAGFVTPTLPLIDILTKFSEAKTVTIGGNLLSSSVGLELSGWLYLPRLRGITIVDWRCNSTSEIRYLYNLLTRLAPPLKTFTFLRCEFTAQYPLVDPAAVPFNLVDLCSRFYGLLGRLHVSDCTIRIPSRDYEAKLIEDVGRASKTGVDWRGTQFVAEDELDMMEIADY